MFLLLHPDDDGDNIPLIHHFDLGITLNDYGVETFHDEKWFKENLDPSYWKEGHAVLLECTVRVPAPVVKEWKLI